MNQEFAQYIKNHIQEYLPQDYQDANITLEEITKGNDRTLTGLSSERTTKQRCLPSTWNPMRNNLKKAGQ